MVGTDTPVLTALGMVTADKVGGKVGGVDSEAVEVGVTNRGEAVKVDTALCVKVAPRLPPAVVEGVEDKDASPEPTAVEDTTERTLAEAIAEEVTAPLLVCCNDPSGLKVPPAEPLDPAEVVDVRVALPVVEGEGVDEDFEPCAERVREGEGEEDGEVEEHLDTWGERELEALNVSCGVMEDWIEGLLVGVPPADDDADRVPWLDPVGWVEIEAWRVP